MSTARTFDSIVVIFNPNSTGDALKLAEELKASLGELLPYAVDVELQPTAHAGHAVDLAREAAEGGRNVLVVSVSGDGSYNEVVNGVMQAGNPNAVCAVKAAATTTRSHSPDTTPGRCSWATSRSRSCTTSSTSSSASRGS